LEAAVRQTYHLLALVYNWTVLLWVKNILNSYFFNITMDDKMVFWGMSNFFDALPSQLLKSDPLLELAIQA
jgi:hypothetical protein